ncbi:MAG: hypothetical protein KGZ97_05365 [Bacteroidetes bacterium]|nr:hypothetical protein [Bacteroidota bacterium]
MKTFLIYCLAIFILLSSNGCVHSQNDEKQIETMLKDFYTAYHNAWAKKSTPNVLMNELDSLYQVYCTNSLRSELEKLFHKKGFDHDIFTNDYGTDDESMKTMTITKDLSKVDSYIVSYIVNTEDPSNRPIKKNVVVNLLLKKEKDTYKINEVK